ncbi:amidohydrolase family protein [Bacillus sp. 1P06AnD]|uniref:amidohydrolase family protein n=1 Tax=Bacillus sp. 1P06AnD TaxID=3132208 RepID=UPI0039A379BD
MEKKHLLLKGGHLIDMESGHLQQSDILILNGRIAQVSSSELETASDTKTIDLQDSYIIPGLIDMHVHIKETFAPLFTAAGITTVRNCAGNVLELKRMVHAQEDAPTPRIITADRMIDGPPGLWGDTSPFNFNTSEQEEARQEVRRQVEAGADFIKVYGWLNKEVMEATVEEASLHGKEVSCDLMHSTQVNALDAAEIGVKWFEHATGILQALYPSWNMQASQPEWEAIDWEHPDILMIEQVCKQLLAYQVKLCPTMVLYDQMKNSANVWQPNQTVIEKAKENTGLIQQWARLSTFTEALEAQGKQISYIQKIAAVYHRMGGVVVAGTDTPAGIFTFPGMALHRELELFVEAGFSPLEALQATTIAAAKSLNLQDQLGIIKEGAKADILILDKNPLDDISNTKRIRYLIKGGRLYTQDEIFQAIPDEEAALSAYNQFINDWEASCQPIPSHNK